LEVIIFTREKQTESGTDIPAKSVCNKELEAGCSYSQSGENEIKVREKIWDFTCTLHNLILTKNITAFCHWIFFSS
jgi:hypothetical protein